MPGGRQQVVGLVDDDPVRPAGAPPGTPGAAAKGVEERWPALELDAEQVDDHVLPGLREHVKHFGDTRLALRDRPARSPPRARNSRLPDRSTQNWYSRSARRSRSPPPASICRSPTSRRENTRAVAAVARPPCDRRGCQAGCRGARAVDSRSRKSTASNSRSARERRRRASRRVTTVGAGLRASGRRSPPQSEHSQRRRKCVVVLGVADADDVMRRRTELARAPRRARSPC